MEDATEGSVQPQVQPARSSSVGRQTLWFLPHLTVVYVIVNFCTPQLAGWTRGRLLPFLHISSTSSSQFEFFFSHLLAFSFVPAFLTGLANARFKHKAAEFVWAVPTVILAYKLITFSTVTSVLRSQSSSAFHQYFGGGFLIPEYRDWQDFWRIARSNPDMIRGMAQHSFTAPFYAGVGYSVAAWISLRADLHRKVIERVSKWEEWKFGNRNSLG